MDAHIKYIPEQVIKSSLKAKQVQVSEVEDGDEVDAKGNIELYGEWQLEPLCLPHASNGIVPKVSAKKGGI